MERFSLITVLKYLAGILLAQAAAVVMAIAAFQARLVEHWGVFAVFALLIGIFAALWSRRSPTVPGTKPSLA